MIATVAKARTGTKIATATQTRDGNRAGREKGGEIKSDVPDDGWSLEELTARAMAEEARIARDEGTATPCYWYQGKALNAARRRFTRGAWGVYLAECAISDDRARTARKLAKAFPRVEALEGLSVRQAMRLAKGEPSDPDTARLLRNLRARFRHAINAVRLAADKVRAADDRAILAKSIQKTTAALSAIGRACEKGEPS